ncbi:hypothetical protein [Streptomyces triticirhizae]|uniref:hypothetical protein n=1 Tax=Streptomyces triticirhizae TaxID=2483353 RepID=UPI0018F68BF5|nr:hypothetical protein [Streptomyces triticirhizae]
MTPEVEDNTVDQQPTATRPVDQVPRPAPPRRGTPPPGAPSYVSVPAQLIIEQGLGDAVFCVVVAMDSLGRPRRQAHDSPCVPIPTALLGNVPAAHVRAYALLAAREAAGRAATEEELAVFLRALHPEQEQGAASAEARAALGNLQALGWVSASTEDPPRHTVHTRPYRSTR